MAANERCFCHGIGFGVKPLHWMFLSGLFAFASELGPLAQLPECSGMDPNGFAFAYHSPSLAEGCEETVLAGVHRLMPGHSLTLRAHGKPRIHRWWNTLDYLEVAPDSFEDQVARFDELFTDACRLRMRSDIPIGTALSGGLDSGSVLCTMDWVVRRTGSGLDRVPDDWQRAFVAVYSERRNDEEFHAREIVDRVGAKGHFLSMGPPADPDEVARIVRANEAVPWDIPVGSWRVYEAMRRAGVYVSLDGHPAATSCWAVIIIMCCCGRETLKPSPRSRELAERSACTAPCSPRRTDTVRPHVRRYAYQTPHTGRMC